MQIETELPSCATYAGNGGGGSATSMTVTIYATIPEDTSGLHCPAGGLINKTIVLGPVGVPGAPPPLVSTNTQINHGPTGPLRVVAGAFNWSQQ
jgi:hypothetical protein